MRVYLTKNLDKKKKILKTYSDQLKFTFITHKPMFIFQSINSFYKK